MQEGFVETTRSSEIAGEMGCFYATIRLISDAFLKRAAENLVTIPFNYTGKNFLVVDIHVCFDQAEVHNQNLHFHYISYIKIKRGRVWVAYM